MDVDEGSFMTEDDPVTEEASASSQVVLENLANDVQTGQDTVSDDVKEIQDTLEGIQTGLGLTDLPSEEMIEDASLDEPTTEDGAKLKSWFSSFKDSFTDSTQGETPESIFEKFGGGKTAFWALVLAGLIAAIVTLKDMSSALTGCYMTNVDPSGNSFNQPVKLSCSEGNCNCTNITNCIPTAQPCSANVNYYWKNVSPLQALAMLPGIVVKGVANGVLQPSSSFLNSVKGPVMIIGIMIILIILAYTAYKHFSK